MLSIFVLLSRLALVVFILLVSTRIIMLAIDGVRRAGSEGRRDKSLIKSLRDIFERTYEY